MSERTAIVMTTINDAVSLDGYGECLARSGHLDDVSVIVIPDRKTPPRLFDRCVALRRSGVKIACPTLEEQATFLGRVGRFADLVPYDSDNRRNIGFLMALADGCDVVISVDDDNHCRPGDDFIGEHRVVARDPECHVVLEANGGWHNVMEMLEVAPPVRTFARGFPYARRTTRVEATRTPAVVRVGMNAGLWLGDPDLNAMTWLESPVRATALVGDPIVLGRATWTPVNTQNTALRWDVMAAYWFVRMGHEVGGLRIDRFGDIFSGYFAQACMKHLGDHVRVGTPLSMSIRNAHDPLLDARRELACILLLEDVLAWLPEAPLSGSTYPETYASLAAAIDEQADRFTGRVWEPSARGFLHDTAMHMRAWLEAYASVR